MATPSKSTTDFLKWADEQYNKRGFDPEAKVTAFDKFNSNYAYIVNKKETWKEVYDLAVSNFYAEGGKEKEIDIYSPLLAKENLKEKTKKEKRAKKELAITDPFQAQINKEGIGVTVDPDTGKTYVNNANKGEVFVYGVTKAKVSRRSEEDTLLTIRDNFGLLRDEILVNATRDGTLDKLFNDLYNAQLISKETRDTKNAASADFSKGLVYALREYSVKVIDEQKLNTEQGLPPKNALDFGSYITDGFPGLPAPTTDSSTSTITTLRPDAYDDANRWAMLELGRPASKEEKELYYKKLRDAESSAVITSSTTTDALGNQISRNVAGQNLSDTDRMLIFGKIISKSIKGSDLDSLVKAGGTASQDISEIMEYAKDYGVQMSQEKAMRFVANKYKTGTSLDSIKTQIMEISKGLYGNTPLGSRISANVNVAALGQNLISSYARLTGEDPNKVTVFNPMVNDALLNNESTADFEKRIKTTPETQALWLETPAAKEEASSYAYAILNSFGFMA
jgi:hypothetical protein